MTVMSPTVLTPQQQVIRDLSDRIVLAQKPIRILDAVKWGPDIKEAFFKSGCTQLPKIDAHYYQSRHQPFDLNEKKNEFQAIEQAITKQLGTDHGAAKIMLRMCREYRLAVDLVAARGTAEFSQIAKQLYGSAQDAFYPGAPALKDIPQLLTTPLSMLQRHTHSELDEKRYNSEQAVSLLSERLSHYFTDRDNPVVVVQSDDIVADAAAGASSIKLRRDALFSERDLKVLEVHEGWVHVGTSLNGAAQPICRFLGKGAPSSTITQEGLAVITEIFTFSSNPDRVRRIIDRVTAIDMAESGADFIEIFRHFVGQGLTDEQSYSLTSRIFRGSTPVNGPFTKDLAYAKGFVLIYNYIRLAVQQGLTDHIPVLFVGKTAIEDLHILLELIQEGLVMPPKYMPPQFSDMAALSAWMCFSLFMNKLDLQKLSANYQSILHR